MRHSLRVVLGLSLALSVAGCSDYLSGPGVGTDPNNITSLTRPGPLYVAVQVAGPPEREGQVARDAAMYTQQIAGFTRQQQAYDRYLSGPGDMDSYFGAVYGSTINLTGGGGLLDIHKIQQLALKRGDSLFVGIAKVYEAMVVGYAADVWGDIPYREATDSTKLTPHFDPQAQVYADVQAQLDSAINIYLKATGPTNAGPTADNSELVYAGKDAAGLRAVYTAVAHSLRARYYMHQAERDPSNYQHAIDEAKLGIASPNDDFLWYSDATASNNNIWWQFNSARAGDIVPGAAIIEILKNRIKAGVEDSARMKFYFTPALASAKGDTLPNGKPRPLGYWGYRPGAATNVHTNGAVDAGNGSPQHTYSGFGSFIDGASGPGDFRQPEITWAETQLILAEATWHNNCPSCASNTVVPAAQTFLDAVRGNRRYGATGGAAVTFPPLTTSEPATLENIMEEKYVALFLNPEVWNDYKRTCLPALAPAPAAGSTEPGTSPIPGRLPYGLSEVNANPNTPTTSSAGAQITSVSQNPNDPNPCPVLNYVSTPLAN